MRPIVRDKLISLALSSGESLSERAEYLERAVTAAVLFLGAQIFPFCPLAARVLLECK